MKPATLLLVTFFVWIAAKGRLTQYWKLATTNNVGNGNNPSTTGIVGGGVGSMSPPSPNQVTNPIGSNG